MKCTIVSVLGPQTMRYAVCCCCLLLDVKCDDVIHNGNMVGKKNAHNTPTHHYTTQLGRARRHGTAQDCNLP